MTRRAFQYLLVVGREIRLTRARPEPLLSAGSDPGYLLALIQREGTSRVEGHTKTQESDAVKQWELLARRNPGAKVVLGRLIGKFKVKGRSFPVYLVLRIGSFSAERGLQLTGGAS